MPDLAQTVHRGAVSGSSGRPPVRAGRQHVPTGPLRQPKLTKVARERGLRHVDPLAGQERAKTLLTANALPIDQIEDLLMPTVPTGHARLCMA